MARFAKRYGRRYKRYRRYKRANPGLVKLVKAVAARQAKKWTPSKEIRFVAQVSQFLTNGTVGQRVNVTNLTSIAVGTQMNQRIGNKIYITGIKFDIYCSNASTSLSRYFNVCIAQDIATNQTLDINTFSNMMEDSAFAETAPSAVNTNFQYTYNRELLRPYFKARYLLGTSPEPDSDRQVSYYWKPKRPLKVVYERTNSLEVVRGKLWLLLHLSEAGQNASADVCDYQWRAQVFFRSVA